jgi:hypothetical protein
LRGKAKTDKEQAYRMYVTIKNEDSNPLLLYSFWRDLETSVRNYTLAGENGNPLIFRIQ